MNAVTVSPKYQVVIPLQIREKLKLRPGTKLQVISFDDRIELVLIHPIQKMRGFLKGCDPTFSREKEDRV